MTSYMITHSHILRHIELIRATFPNAIEVCTQGSCIRFAISLQHLYPSGKVYYDHDHAVFVLNGFIYDITGDLNVDLEKYIELSTEHFNLAKLDKMFQLVYEEIREMPTNVEDVKIDSVESYQGTTKSIIKS